MNITDPRFVYLPASSHSDPEKFRQRMRERAKQVQQPTLTMKEISCTTPTMRMLNFKKG